MREGGSSEQRWIPEHRLGQHAHVLRGTQTHPFSSILSEEERDNKTHMTTDQPKREVAEAAGTSASGRHSIARTHTTKYVDALYSSHCCFCGPSQNWTPIETSNCQARTRTLGVGGLLLLLRLLLLVAGKVHVLLAQVGERLSSELADGLHGQLVQGFRHEEHVVPVAIIARKQRWVGGDF